MFEKEAEEMMRQNGCRTHSGNFIQADKVCELIQKGAEFGYNKANEWHDINELEPSKEQLGKQLLIRIESVIGDTDYDYLVYKYKGESITDVAGVLAWKEIK